MEPHFLTQKELKARLGVHPLLVRFIAHLAGAPGKVVCQTTVFSPEDVQTITEWLEKVDPDRKFHSGERGKDGGAD